MMEISKRLKNAKPCICYEEEIHHFPIWGCRHLYSLYCQLKLAKNLCDICQKISKFQLMDLTHFPSWTLNNMAELGTEIIHINSHTKKLKIRETTRSKKDQGCNKQKHSNIKTHNFQKKVQVLLCPHLQINIKQIQ